MNKNKSENDEVTAKTEQPEHAKAEEVSMEQQLADIGGKKPVPNGFNDEADGLLKFEGYEPWEIRMCDRLAEILDGMLSERLYERHSKEIMATIEEDLRVSKVQWQTETATGVFQQCKKRFVQKIEEEEPPDEEAKPDADSEENADSDSSDSE